MDNSDFDLIHLVGGDVNQIQDILTRQEQAYEAITVQMTKARKMLDVLVKKRDEQYQLYQQRIDEVQVVGEEAYRMLLEHKRLLDEQIESERAKENDFAHDSITQAGDISGEHDIVDHESNDMPMQSQPDSRLKALLTQRAQVEAKLDRFRLKTSRRISPFQNLPPEITQHIFLQCIPNGYEIPRTSSSKAPLLFLRVCKTWRGLALALPSLWSSISVKIEDGVHSPPLPVVNTWIERSGSCPLSFCIHEKSLKEDEDEDKDEDEDEEHAEADDERSRRTTALETALALFIPHHARWKRVHLKQFNQYADARSIDLFPAGATAGYYPLLEDFLVKGDWADDEKPSYVRCMSSFLQNAPRLRCIGWISHSWFAGFADAVPWAQLTRFRLESLISLSRFRRILSESPQLWNVDVHIFPTERTLATKGPNVFQPLRHETLEVLVLHIGGMGIGMEGILEHATLPKLKDFSVDFEILDVPCGYVWPHEEFLGFVKRSACALTHFGLNNAPPTDALIPCLAAMSASLQHLCLSTDQAREVVTDDVLKALTSPGNGANVLCPHLQSIKLWNCVASSDGVLSAMVASRRKATRNGPVCRLRSVILALCADRRHDLDSKVFDALNDDKYGITYVVI